MLKEKTANLSIGGFTEYERNGNGGAVVKLGAPASDDAFGITVRGHETRHATRHKPTRKKPVTPNEAIAGQIVDDVNIECTPLPPVSASHLTTYKRAHLKTAMDGVRALLKNKRAVLKGHAKDSVELRNGNLLNAVRTLSMLHHYGQNTMDEIRIRGVGYDHVRAVIGDNMFRGAIQVVRMAKERRKRATAISMLTALMEKPEPEESEEIEIDPTGDSELLTPVSEGDAFDGHMAINDLRPKAVFCAKEKTITRRHAPNGVIINPTRYVSAVVSGDSNGLFSRRVRQKAGGTVLIDASGSMGANRDNLSALCALIPTATVGYYSGYDNKGRGDLNVYAYQGKRFAGELPEKTMHGGNAVDLPAVRWLMKQQRPWTLVSDLEFCGGALGSEVIARALVERATSRGDLTVHRSLDAAYEAFGGKTELANANHRKARAERVEEFSRIRAKRKLKDAMAE